MLRFEKFVLVALALVCAACSTQTQIVPEEVRV